jgi:hypothetical protein
MHAVKTGIKIVDCNTIYFSVNHAILTLA